MNEDISTLLSIIREIKNENNRLREELVKSEARADRMRDWWLTATEERDQLAKANAKAAEANQPAE